MAPFEWWAYLISIELFKHGARQQGQLGMSLATEGKQELTPQALRDTDECKWIQRKVDHLLQSYFFWLCLSIFFTWTPVFLDK
jgi:hypothetical protein